MLALSDVIEFLLELMRDPAAAAAFDNDPEAALAARGLEGVTAQDVRDARLELCDAGDASADGDASPPGGDDPVREIHHTATNYSASHAASTVTHEQSALAFQAAPVTIDDRDTFFFDNSDDDVTIVQDSFNTDDSVDVDVDNSVVNNDVTAINDSFNQVDNSVTENDVVAIDADNSFNDSTEIGDVTLPGGGQPIDPGDGIGDGQPLEQPIDTGDGIGDGQPLDTADDPDAFTSVVETDDPADDAFTSEIADEPQDAAVDEAFDPVA